MGLSPVLDVALIAPRHKAESVLKELFIFGDFHATPGNGSKDPTLHQLEHRAEIGAVNTQVLIQELGVKDQVGVMDQLFGKNPPVQETFTAHDVRGLLDRLDGQLGPLKEKCEHLLQEKKSLEEKINELSNIRDALQLLSGMRFDISLLRSLRRFYVFLGVVTASEMAEARGAIPDVAIVESPLSRSNILMLVVAEKGAGEGVDRVLKSLGLKMLTIPEDLPQIPGEAYEMLVERVEGLRRRLTEVEKMLEEVRESQGGMLVALRDSYEIVRQALHRIGGGGLKLFTVIRGYIPAEKEKTFLETFRHQYPVYLSTPEGRHHGVDRPALMRNRGISAAFEKITLIQGAPRATEVDPTPYVAFFFSIFYGIMFADMGQGAVILAFSLFMLKRVRGDLRKWAVILATLGTASTITGFLIGEAFGFKVGEAVYSPQLIHLVEEHDGAKGFVISEVQRLLIFTIFLGVLHIITGYILGIVKLAREREWSEALFVKLPTLTMYIFGILFGFAFFGAGGDISSILTSTSTAPLIGLPTNLVGSIGVYGAVASIVVLMIGRLVAGLAGLGHSVSVIASVGQGLLEVLENIIHFLSNTISYSRLTILLIVHTALLVLLNSAWEALGVVSLPLMVIGNIGIILLEGMMVFIQSMRLHIYEFFSKFYEGTGEPFRSINNETPFAKIKFGD
ncbi:MAG: V-type ATPase 116kDa subunit family protein [Nitrososphaerota archaeon]